MPRQKKIRHRHKPTPYALFVKKHYPQFRHLDTPQDRIKAIVAAWRAAREKRDVVSTATTDEASE